MILDQLDHAHRYRVLGPGIARAVDYLTTTDFATVEPGRYDLDGDRVFAMVQRYRTKAPAVAVWESHRRYVDVQYVVSGAERVGYVHLSRGPAVKEAYDAEKDAVFYRAGEDFFELSAGLWAIFMPEDVHAPGLVTGTPAAPNEVTKVVVKVDVGLAK